MYSRILVIACVAVALSGCASIIKGSSEEVSVATTPDGGATCELSNSEGHWTVTTPGKTKVDLTKHDLNVSCDKPGYQQAKTTVSSGFQAWTLGNLILGGVIGLAIDAADGAMNEYPHQIDVPMQPTAAAEAPAPGADAKSDPSS